MIRVIATLDNVTATEDDTATFPITINDNCKNDEVTLTAGTEIADDTFYIGPLAPKPRGKRKARNKKRRIVIMLTR